MTLTEFEPFAGRGWGDKELRQPVTAGAAVSGAVDADLDRVIVAWPGLPPHVKAAILALVAAGPG
jgi:hypothetical protein